MADLKKYKITNKETGETFTISSAKPPSKAEADRIINLRKKTKLQGEIADIKYKNRSFAAKLGETLYGPSEALMPEVMAPEEVKKMGVGQRIARKGQEAAAGSIDPGNVATMLPAFAGPLGLAGSSIAGGAQLLYHAPETVSRFIEDPSLETGIDLGMTGLGLLGAGVGTKVGFARGSKVQTPTPKVTAPTSTQPRNQKLLTEAPPIEGEFVDPKQLTGRNQKQIPQYSYLSEGFTDEGAIKTGASKVQQPKVLAPGQQKRITAGEKKPIEMGPSSLTPEQQLESQVEKIDAEFVDETPQQQKLLEGYFGELTKKRTSSLLQQRSKATGVQLRAIDDILKKRGALPDDAEIFPLSETIPDEALMQKVELTVRTPGENRFDQSTMGEFKGTVRDLDAVDPEQFNTFVEYGIRPDKLKRGVSSNNQEPKVVASNMERVNIPNEPSKPTPQQKIQLGPSSYNLEAIDGSGNLLYRGVHEKGGTKWIIKKADGSIQRDILMQKGARPEVSPTGEKWKLIKESPLIKELEDFYKKTFKLNEPGEVNPPESTIPKPDNFPVEDLSKIIEPEITQQILVDPEIEALKAKLAKLEAEVKAPQVPKKKKEVKVESPIDTKVKLASSKSLKNAELIQYIKDQLDKDITPITAIEEARRRGINLQEELKFKSQAKIENEFLRSLDTKVLESMEPGATGKLKEDINLVLGERSATKAFDKTQEKLGKLKEETKEITDENVSSLESGIDEESFTSYQSKLDEIISLDQIDSQTLRDIAELGKKAGLDRETIINDMVDNTPRITNNVNKVNVAVSRAFREGERGGVKLGDLFPQSWFEKKVKGSEAEGPIRSALDQLKMFKSALPRLKPEANIGLMGEAGKKLERIMGDAQFEADKLRGKVDYNIHEALKNLTPREIGQRIAVLDNGKEVVLTKNNMDKYVNWKDGAFTPKKGVKRITRMPGSLSNVILDGAEPASPKIAEAAKLFQSAMETLGTEGELSGVSTVTDSGKTVPFQKMGDEYWPREYTDGFFESLKKNPKDWNRIVSETAKKNGLTIAEVERLFKNKQSYRELTSRGQHRRTFKQDSFVIDPDIIFDHVKQFSGRVGYSKVFGPKDLLGPTLDPLIKQIKNEGFDADFASSTIARMVGRADRLAPAGPLEKGVYDAVTGLNNARLMTSFILNNLANATTIIARVGPINTLKGLGAMLGNLEMSRRMATLSRAAEHTGTLESSGASVAKILGVPISERFMRTWADQSGRITANGLVSYLKELNQSSPQFLRGKKLLDSLLGKDSLSVIERGGLTTEELNRAGWQLAKDSQGIINPATMPPLGETIPTAPLRLGVNLAMQYKRMAMLGMSSLMESLRLNPGRAITTMAITAPIIGEVIGDAGSAIFGGIAGTLTGEGTIKAAIRDINQRGESLSRMIKPILQDKMGLDERQSKIVSRYIENMNRGFALGLIGDLVYSMAYWHGQAGADIVSGGIAPAFEFGWDVSRDIMNTIFPVEKLNPYKSESEVRVDAAKSLVQDVLPQRPVSAYNRSKKEMTGGGGPGITVRPPRLP